MWFKVILQALLATLALGQDVIDVNVGKKGLVYSPENVTAAKGSRINFHFYARHHSVAQSGYNNPCVPSGPDAIYSGIVTPSSGVASKMFTIRVGNTNPIWLYCSYPSHCESGMAMVINPPNSGESLIKYKKAAASVSRSESPSTIQGGVFLPNQESQGSSNSSQANSGTTSTTDEISTLQKAHGTIMGLTVVLLFPLGALSMRLLQARGVIWLHFGWQLVSLFLLTAGFGIGVSMAEDLGVLYNHRGKQHTIFGTVLFALFWVQPVFGIVHHYQFTKTQSRTAVSYIHIWYGRALLIMAIVNGGLGLQLAASLSGRTLAGEIAYGVVAGVIGVVYICGATFGELRRWKARKHRPFNENGRLEER